MFTKNFKRRTAFSLVEILIVVTILGIMAGYITLSAKSTGQTAKAEAEKVAQFFRRYITKADKIHGGFYFRIDTDKITVKQSDKITEDELIASNKCNYTMQKGDNLLSYELPEIRTAGDMTTIETRNVEISLKASEDDAKDFPYAIKVTDGRDGKYWVVFKYDNSI